MTELVFILDRSGSMSGLEKDTIGGFNSMLSEEIKKYVESQLEKAGWSIDVVLSHTTPLKYEPVEVFLSGVDQNRVDKSTEQWLDQIEEKLSYQKWYCGHYHTEKKIDKLEIMFENFDEFCSGKC